MYPIFRTVKTTAKAMAGSMDPMGESVVRFRVWPNDLDTNLHLTNGRYLTMMDLGRVDLAIRSGLARICLQKHWVPLAGSVHIRYRRGLAPFKLYDLRTRMVCWDQKWFFLEQNFVTGQVVRAQALVKMLFRHGKHNLPPQQVAQVLGASDPAGQSPPMPQHLSLLLAGEDAWRSA